MFILEFSQSYIYSKVLNTSREGGSHQPMSIKDGNKTPCTMSNITTLLHNQYMPSTYTAESFFIYVFY